MRTSLDTNVVSEVRRSNADPLVVRRLRALDPQDTYISVVTGGELVYGAKRLPAGVRRRDLEAWIASLQQGYAARILNVDVETANPWGELTATVQAAGRLLEPQDGLIAATTLRHGLRLTTRNIKDFATTGILLNNPWEPWSPHRIRRRSG